MLLRVANGDESAFEQLYQQHADNIYGVAFAYTKSAEIAEEIVQDVFLKIWMSRESLAKIDHFANYLFIIARNQLLNYLSRKTREKDYLQHLTRYFNDNSITPEQVLLYKESSELIEKAISLLPEQQKLVYRMVKVEGIKLEEIGTLLNLSRNTVRNHLSRALQFIRHFIELNASPVIISGLLAAAV